MQFGVAKWYPENINGYTYEARLVFFIIYILCFKGLVCALDEYCVT